MMLRPLGGFRLKVPRTCLPGQAAQGLRDLSGLHSRCWGPGLCPRARPECPSQGAGIGALKQEVGIGPHPTPASCVVHLSLASHTPKRPVREMLGSGPFHRPGARLSRQSSGAALGWAAPWLSEPRQAASPRCLQAVCMAGMGGDARRCLHAAGIRSPGQWELQVTGPSTWPGQACVPELFPGVSDFKGDRADPWLPGAV